MRARGRIGLLLLAFRVWRRLSPAQRAIVTSQLRRHGPRAAAALVAFLRSSRSRHRRRARGR